MSIISVAESDGRIIGVDGTVLKNIKIGEEVLHGSYGTDSAVHPDFRRRGVSKNMSNLKRGLRNKADIKFNYSSTENPIIIDSHSKTNPIFPYFILSYSRIRDIGLHNRINTTKTLSARIRRLGLHAINLSKTLLY